MAKCTVLFIISKVNSFKTDRFEKDYGKMFLL